MYASVLAGAVHGQFCSSSRLTLSGTRGKPALWRHFAFSAAVVHAITVHIRRWHRQAINVLMRSQFRGGHPHGTAHEEDTSTRGSYRPDALERATFETQTTPHRPPVVAGHRSQQRETMQRRCGGRVHQGRRCDRDFHNEMASQPRECLRAYAIPSFWTDVL